MTTASDPCDNHEGLINMDEYKQYNLMLHRYNMLMRVVSMFRLITIIALIVLPTMPAGAYTWGLGVAAFLFLTCVASEIYLRGVPLETAMFVNLCALQASNSLVLQKVMIIPVQRPKEKDDGEK